jgi:hypothetical protein
LQHMAFVHMKHPVVRPFGKVFQSYLTIFHCALGNSQSNEGLSEYNSQ